MRPRNLIPIWLFAILISFSYSDMAAQCDRERDSLVLIELYDANPDFQSKVNWVGNGFPMGQWDYVYLNGNGCVETLDLYGLYLVIIPESFGDLSNLEAVFLEFNEIEELPASIGNLRALEVLSIGWNKLESLPVEITNLRNLRTLSVSANNYSEVPSWIGTMT